jgi:hypothetical protein
VRVGGNASALTVRVAARISRLSKNSAYPAAPLEHFSEFRIGSSVLLLTILVDQALAAVDSRGQFEPGEEE